MVDRQGACRIERIRGDQARDYALDHRALMPEHGAEVLDLGGAGGGVAVWGSSFGARNVSRAFALGIDGDVEARELDRVEAFYAAHGSPVRIMTSPWTHPSLFALLASRRYRAVTFDNVLTRSLDPRLAATGSDSADASSIERPAGVSIVRVEPRRDAVLAWGAVVRFGFGMAGDDPRLATADRVFERSRRASLFLATIDSEPAGGGALDLREGVATLFAASTLPAYRRRGVQGALIAARVASAREAGADLAVVITTPGSDSERNVEQRRGFRIGYTATVFESPP